MHTLLRLQRALHACTLSWWAALLCASAPALVSCSASSRPDNGTHTTTTTSNGSGGGANGGAGGAGASGGLGIGANGGSTGTGGIEFAEVYAHSETELYRLDPITKAVTDIGPFTGCSSVIDLAIDKNHDLYGTTFGGLYHIDKNSAACGPIALNGYPNSLSFVPKGTLDPNAEALVGYIDDAYVRIDATTGNVSPVGSVGGGFASSGDVVSVIGGGTYLTAYGPGCSDCLLQIDPATGALIKNWGPLNHSAVFGLAFWGGAAYGFTNDGVVFQIDFGVNDVTTTVIPVPNAPPTLSFWGAGSSTDAPLTPPN